MQIKTIDSEKESDWSEKVHKSKEEAKNDKIKT
jgi:hypothetical protein